MTDIYDRAKATAKRLLGLRAAGGKGAVLVLTRVTGGGVVQGPATATNYTGSGVRTNYSNKEIDGTRVVRGDFKLLISPVQASGADMPQPGPADKVLFDGVNYAVIAVMPWNYAGVACGFAAQVRA